MSKNITKIIEKDIKVPAVGVVFYSLLLAASSFFAGYALVKLKYSSPVTVGSQSSVVFAAEKNSKPQLDFYVMSFCPYGNQMEDVLRPVFDLLGSKVDINPHYIFDKVDDLKSYCAQRSGDPTQCSSYVSQGYFKTESECKKVITDNSAKCLDDKNYIKGQNGVMYSSLHGRQEGNQDIREMCAWKLTNDKKQWWDFVGLINKNCTDQNADSCWEDQAKNSGYDPAKITECFNQDGIALVENEIKLTDSQQVQGSPTVFINGVSFPPEAAYAQDGKGTLKIGNKVATQDKYRTPNVVKTAICASFKRSPGECNTTLNDLTGAAPAAGGCQ